MEQPVIPRRVPAYVREALRGIIPAGALGRLAHAGNGFASGSGIATALFVMGAIAGHNS